MPFGEHLCTQQDHGLILLNPIINFLPASDPTGAVAVDPNHIMIWKKFIQMFFNFTCSHSESL